MSEPTTRIRVQPQGSGAIVRLLMQHEMETGQRKDAAGKTIPAWHITEVTAQLNGQTVLKAQWGPGVSKNPFLQFSLKRAVSGDKLVVSWRDNRGQQRSDQVVVA